MNESNSSGYNRYRLLNEADLPKLPQMEWVVKNILPSSGLAAIFGPPGSGKSFICLDLALAIAGGQSWFGARVKQTPVAYMWLEGASGFRTRVDAWKLRTGQALPKLFSFVLQPFKLTDPKDLADLAQVLPAGAIVVIDTLNKAASPMDENSSADMGKVIEAARALQAQTGGLVVLVHHTGKNVAAGLRGHSSLLGALDAAIEVTREGAVRCWCVTKQKDGADGVERRFTLLEVGLGEDQDGDPITSCCVCEDQSDASTPLPQGLNQRAVLEAIEPLFDAGTADAPGTPPSTVSIRIEQAIMAGASKLSCPSDKRNTRAREAISGMISRGLLGSHEGWLWRRRQR